MQGKVFSLRLSLLASVVVVVLVLASLGGISLARDAFDEDYDDCPAVTRLEAVNGVTVERTDEEDEIRVSWNELDSAVLDSLGPNGYKARLTIIVEGQGPQNVALGDTSLVLDEIDFSAELVVSVAITQGGYVLSDIAEAEFTSGMPAPSFSTTVKQLEIDTTTDPDTYTAVAWNDSSGKRRGVFYYLGFNDLFDNWHISTPFPNPLSRVDGPQTAKFRVGLAHGEGTFDPDGSNFAHYRISIEDSSGDLLGYQAETVTAANTYFVDSTLGANNIFFGDTSTDPLGAADFPLASLFTNIRLSNRVTENRDPISPYQSLNMDSNPDTGWRTGLTYGNLYDSRPRLFQSSVIPAEATGALLVEPPVEYFDFPSDVFDNDGTYIISAWAEDDEGTRISPLASITLKVQEGDSLISSYQGYPVRRQTGSAISHTVGYRLWAESSIDTEIRVYGFSIHDE